jgi:hypothetical protein
MRRFTRIFAATVLVAAIITSPAAFAADGLDLAAEKIFQTADLKFDGYAPQAPEIQTCEVPAITPIRRGLSFTDLSASALAVLLSHAGVGLFLLICAILAIRFGVAPSLWDAEIAQNPTASAVVLAALILGVCYYLAAVMQV